MNINRSYKTMVIWRVMFGEIISEIGRSRSPVYYKSLLINTIYDPVEIHIHCFSTFEFDGRFSETDYSGIVSLYWSRRLRMAEFLKYNTEWYGGLINGEDATDFSFSYCYHDTV